MYKILIIICLVVSLSACSQVVVNDVHVAEVKPREHFLGDPQAPITLSIYSDFECEFCREFHQQILPKLQTDFISKGLVKFEIKHFPLFNVHQFSFLAAKSTYCAGEQRQYWTYVDQLYATKDILNKAKLIELADNIGISNRKKFSLCLETESYDYLIQETLTEGADKGLRGIPTIYIDETYINGVPEYSALKKALNDKLEAISAS